jgi:hypothetical protein
VSVQPDLVVIYWRKVAKLERLLDDVDRRDEAMTAIRSMTDTIVLTSRERGGLHARLTGNRLESSPLPLCAMA